MNRFGYLRVCLRPIASYFLAIIKLKMRDNLLFGLG